MRRERGSLLRIHSKDPLFRSLLKIPSPAVASQEVINWGSAVCGSAARIHSATGKMLFAAFVLVGAVVLSRIYSTR